MGVTKVRLSSKWIEKLALPASGTIDYQDITEPHLVLRAGATGASFGFFGRVNGRLMRRKIGDANKMSVTAARLACKKMAVQLAGGEDPLLAKRAKAAMPSVGGLFQLWLEKHARPHLSTANVAAQRWEHFAKAITKRKADELRLVDVVSWHNAVAEKHGPVLANRMVELLRSVYNKSLELIGMELHNPAKGVKRFREEPRAVFMGVEQMKRFATALQQMDDPWPDFFTLLLLCGCRQGNLRSMRFEDLDLDNCRWIVPASMSKNRRTMIVHLAAPAVDILERRRASVAGPWVFPSSRGDSHIVALYEPWEKLKRAAGLEGFRRHDIRRSFASALVAAGVPLAAVAGALGHSGMRSVGIYARFAPDQIAQHVQQGTANIAKLLPK